MTYTRKYGEFATKMFRIKRRDKIYVFPLWGELLTCRYTASYSYIVSVSFTKNYFMVFRKTEGVTPLYFLKKVLKDDFELNPAS